MNPQPKGHQFYSDVDAYAGRLHVVYHDTRSDTATGPPGTVGDFRTVPFSNQWVGGAVGSTHTNQGVETFYSRSTDGGATWTHQKVSGVSYPLNYEQFGNRDTPFFGDYNYVSASAHERPDGVAERAGLVARHRSALHGRERHRRLRRAPVPGLRERRLGRRHLPRRRRARPEHLRVRRRP